jgi:hypothetical protein
MMTSPENLYTKNVVNELSFLLLLILPVLTYDLVATDF